MSNETPPNNNCIRCTGEDRYLSMTEHLAKQLCSLHKLPPREREPAVHAAAFGAIFASHMLHQDADVIDIRNTTAATARASTMADAAVLAYEQLNK